MIIAIILIVAALCLYYQHKVYQKAITRLNEEKTAMSNENKRLQSIILDLKDEQHTKSISKRK